MAGTVLGTLYILAHLRLNNLMRKTLFVLLLWTELCLPTPVEIIVDVLTPSVVIFGDGLWEGN